jgi:hypothetical protein
MNQNHHVNPFDFTTDAKKLQLLEQANNNMHITNASPNSIIFIYSAPKVGSTCLVSTLRLFAIDKYVTIHLHDEEMLKVMTGIQGISVEEIILYNKFLGKDVFVIDVYRSPIERKISAFFEKIGAYHFNNTDANVNKYDVQRVIDRFNHIFPHLANGDHFVDKYNIRIPDRFDFENKHLLLQENGVHYIKLRLKDSHLWNTILSNILKVKLFVVKDYESEKKIIKDLYLDFKKKYKIPKNLLDDVIKCKYLHRFYSEEEIKEYYDMWLAKSGPNVVPYTEQEYKLYEQITMENCHLDYIQKNHYMDEGCRCDACNLKRWEIAQKVFKGINVNDKVRHINAKKELFGRRVATANALNSFKQSHKLKLNKI